MAKEFGKLIAERTAVPDMALSGRMLEPDKSSKIWEKLHTTVEAALQVAHALSTHEAHLQVDYYVATDDIPGEDAGAGYLDEAMFASACFYKYFSINWDTLVGNLKGNEELAAHTVGAFIRAAAVVNPAGKQNSFASHCEPCGLLVEIKKTRTPTSYANAFAEPVERVGKPDDDAPDEHSIEGRSVACLADHVQAIRNAYGVDSTLLWYSPKLWRFPFRYWERSEDGRKKMPKLVTERRFDILGGEEGKPGGFVEAIINEIAHVKNIRLRTEA